MAKVENKINWKVEVLGTAKKAKMETGSFGAMRGVLLKNAKAFELSPIFVDLLKKSKGNIEYEVITSIIKPNKQGLYSYFNILKTMRKELEFLQDAFAKAAAQREKSQADELIKPKKKAPAKKAAPKTKELETA